MKNHIDNLQDVDLAEVLGMHGYFLEEACIQAFKGSSRFEIEESRYPVKKIDGDQTEIDIIVCLKNSNKVLVCECKREDIISKKWIFTKSSEMTNGFNRVELSKISGNQQVCSLMRKKVELLPIHETFDTSFCIMPSKSGNRSKSNFVSDSKPIYDSCSQLITGYCSLIIEIRSQIEKAPIAKTISFYPILITTAKLSSYQFDNSKLDIVNGRLNGKIEERELNWLNYRWYSIINEYGNKLPDTMHGYEPSFLKKNYKNWDIMIINSAHLSRFLEEFRIYE